MPRGMRGIILRGIISRGIMPPAIGKAISFEMKPSVRAGGPRVQIGRSSNLDRPDSRCRRFVRQPMSRVEHHPVRRVGGDCA
jgi:hypothetical protein